MSSPKKIELSAAVVATLRERGGTWAFYLNVALDSADLGTVQCLRVGPGCTYETAPTQFPDTPQTGPGWKYQYQGTSDVADIPDDGCLTFPEGAS